MIMISTFVLLRTTAVVARVHHCLCMTSGAFDKLAKSTFVGRVKLPSVAELELGQKHE